MKTVRFRSYLSPGIPEALFQFLVHRLGEQLDMPTTLDFDFDHSGPPPGSPIDWDVGFICSPAYIRLRSLRKPPIELLPLAFVYHDQRNKGKPLYFSDVIVRKKTGIKRFQDLKGKRFCYTNRISLSGYYSVLQRLNRAKSGLDFFSSFFPSGSHHNSLGLVLKGKADAAAIDSNVLLHERQKNPDLLERLRVIETWGPYPIQPIVTRKAFPWKTEIAVALIELREELKDFLINDVDLLIERDFDRQQEQLKRCAHLDRQA